MRRCFFFLFFLSFFSLDVGLFDTKNLTLRHLSRHPKILFLGEPPPFFCVCQFIVMIIIIVFLRHSPQFYLLILLLVLLSIFYQQQQYYCYYYKNYYCLPATLPRFTYLLIVNHIFFCFFFFLFSLLLGLFDTNKNLTLRHLFRRPKNTCSLAELPIFVIIIPYINNIYQ